MTDQDPRTEEPRTKERVQRTNACGAKKKYKIIKFQRLPGIREAFEI